ncbi:alanine racemase [Erythrobacter sp. KY5]|uniref:alanine racemase n=1 Tax=Erythrobacter sp. KY5 TaxID=2011159 RepID=UPI000DBF083D|nr:alanine racemase [Erythrobacter sp. KY5]AWW74766.1 alanine racemase [Erythrobacter sp. KY5]
MQSDKAGSAILPPSGNELRVDTSALQDNWRLLDRLSGSASAGAAVKADCYGLGVSICVPALVEAGCQSFFVANWDEADELSHYIAPGQIAVLQGPVTRQEAHYARDMGIVPVINSLHQARLWAECGGGTCHLMIDTGINRLGIHPSEVTDPAIAALDIDIAMSHLASGDEDGPMNARQLAAYRDSLGSVRHRRQSLANSAGIALGADYSFDLTRPGLALYGGIPRRELEGQIKQVAYLRASVLQTRNLKPGDAVGYNGEFVASEPMRVGTVSIGYADGFLRARGPGEAFLFESKRLPLIGKVSMDMVVVDLADAPDVKEGDWLDVPFDLANAARQSSVSQYELLTVLGRRLRHWS